MKRMKLIYEPTGAAKEYGDLALNIFDSCPHSCDYCFVPLVKKCNRDLFHAKHPEVRKADFFKLLNQDLAKIENQGKHIFLCFSCDPFPMGHEHVHGYTIQAIKDIHDSGNYVTVLTKGRIPEDAIKALWIEDIVGVTISCGDEMAKTIERSALPPSQRLAQLAEIKQRVKFAYQGETLRIKTFVSCEPVYGIGTIYDIIKNCDFIDEYRIGKLNYVKNDTDWAAFGKKVELLCQQYKRGYMIKEGLRRAMNGQEKNN